ncbi:MAG: response regulator [Gaiellaceae bacterium]|nr:response regulator [Gaiellaceae bacterium]
MQRLRVLLVEDSDVYRESLLFLLDRDERLEVVGAAHDGRSAILACAELDPDVVVCDYRLPDLDAAEVAREVRLVAPACALVFLSASAGTAEYDAARRAGAALVRKDEGLGALVAAIVAAAGRAETCT